MKEQRRQYSKEFKFQIVQEYLHGEKSGPHLAEEYGLHPNLIYRWTKAYEESEERPFPGSGRQVSLHEETQKEIEISRLRLENDILKKALSILGKSELKHIK